MLQNEATIIIEDVPVLTIEVLEINDVVILVNTSDMPLSENTLGEYGSGTYGSGTYG